MNRFRMMLGNERRNFCFLALLGFGFFGVLFGIGCTRVKEEPAWFQSTEIVSTDDLLGKIKNVDCLFALNSMKREYILQEGEPNMTVLMALDARIDQLVDQSEVFPAIPGALDFLGWKIQRVSEDQTASEARNTRKYQVSGYFVVTGKMERDWIFKIMTKVDDEHVSLLPPDRQKAKYLNWQVHPKTSTWEPGEHYVLSTIVELMPIPYYIFAQMFLYPEMINHAAFAYGWFADPEEISDLQ